MGQFDGLAKAFGIDPSFLSKLFSLHQTYPMRPDTTTPPVQQVPPYPQPGQPDGLPTQGPLGPLTGGGPGGPPMMPPPALLQMMMGGMKR